MSTAPTLRPGETNRHRQRVVGRAARVGSATMDGQLVYVLQCTVPGCGHRYGEEGIRVHQRRCPRCQDGTLGLPVPQPEPSLFPESDVAAQPLS